MMDSRYHHSTSLSKHAWALKDQHVGYSIQWSMLQKAKDYQKTTKRCNLCLAEKLEIIMANKERTLNRRSELISKCRHENKFYLSSFQPPVSQVIHPVSLYLVLVITQTPSHISFCPPSQTGSWNTSLFFRLPRALFWVPCHWANPLLPPLPDNMPWSRFFWFCFLSDDRPTGSWNTV